MVLESLKNIRIARVSTIPFFIITQLQSQLQALGNAGAEVTVVTSDGELAADLSQNNYYDFNPINICREINLSADIKTLYHLWKFFRKQKFHIVHSTTPKAGLLCSIAAFAARVPIRLHTFTGQTWVTMRGIKRTVVKFCDKLIILLNTKCYTDSFSQREFLIKNKLTSNTKLHVLGSGSLAGVNMQRFSLKNYPQTKTQIKSGFGIDKSTIVLLFVGRVTEDKGIFELLAAVGQLLQEGKNILLFIVGPFELLFENEIRQLAQKLCGDKAIFTGFSNEPELYMALADILCLPSYREGFGTVVIEAAAMGIPSVGTEIYGLRDAVIDKETGLLIEPKNVPALKHALLRLIDDEDYRLQLANKAQIRALKEFDSQRCSELLITEYESLLNKYNKTLLMENNCLSSSTDS